LIAATRILLGRFPEQLLAAEDAALRNTLARFEHTGSPIITDGEQSKL
jgi:hypothetical protein